MFPVSGGSVEVEGPGRSPDGGGMIEPGGGVVVEPGGRIELSDGPTEDRSKGASGIPLKLAAKAGWEEMPLGGVSPLGPF